MNFQPTLKNDLVTVRPLVQDDYWPLYAVAKDPLIWEGMPAKNRYELKPFTRFFNHLLSTGKSFCILENNNNTQIGTTRYYTVQDRLYMGSTFLGRQYWGGTYNHSFRFLLIDHAFKYYDNVHIHMTHDNKRNQRATEKLGFTHVYDETLKLHEHGKERTFMTYRMTKKNT